MGLRAAGSSPGHQLRLVVLPWTRTVSRNTNTPRVITEHRQQRGPRPGHRNVRTAPLPSCRSDRCFRGESQSSPLLSWSRPFLTAANWKRAGLLRPRPATRAPGVEKPRDVALRPRPVNILAPHGGGPICFGSSVETRVGSGERKRGHGERVWALLARVGVGEGLGCLGEGGSGAPRAPSSAGPSPPHPAGSACSAHLAGVQGPRGTRKCRSACPPSG